MEHPYKICRESIPSRNKSTKSGCFWERTDRRPPPTTAHPPISEKSLVIQRSTNLPPPPKLHTLPKKSIPTIQWSLQTNKIILFDTPPPIPNDNYLTPDIYLFPTHSKYILFRPVSILTQLPISIQRIQIHSAFQSVLHIDKTLQLIR